MPHTCNNHSSWHNFLTFQEKPSIKTVLIVDDEAPFLLSLSDGLGSYATHFSIITASNGKEAVNILKSEKIDLVISDLKMPEMNGFELLAYMSKAFPYVPFIVMTAFGTPEIENKLDAMGALQYLEKPLDITVLAQTITDAISEESSKSSGSGITIESFLHLLVMEKMTCTVKLTSNNEFGYLYFMNGELIAAENNKQKGETAALSIMALEKAEIDIKFTSENKERTITKSLPQLLLLLEKHKQGYTAEEVNKKNTDTHTLDIKTDNTSNINNLTPSDTSAQKSSPPAALTVSEIIRTMNDALGNGLVMFDIASVNGNDSIVRYKSEANITAPLNHLASAIRSFLKENDLPPLNQYIQFDLEKDHCLILYLLKEYIWCILIDTRQTNIDLLKTTVIPQIARLFDKTINSG